jgi:hypothetical protein
VKIFGVTIFGNKIGLIETKCRNVYVTEAKDPYIAFEVAELLNLAFTDPKKFEKKAKKINDIKYDGA